MPNLLPCCLIDALLILKIIAPNKVLGFIPSCLTELIRIIPKTPACLLIRLLIDVSVLTEAVGGRWKICLTN